MRALGIAALCLASSGCATIVQGDKQTVAVNTEPAGATCVLKRDGATIATIDATPSAVTIDKSQHAIAMTCAKNGYRDTAGRLASDFEAISFGGVIFGGVVGPVVDASSGAMHSYPDRISIILQEKRFRSDRERHAYFDAKADAARLEAIQAIRTTETSCSSMRNDACALEVEAVRRALSDRLAEIARLRITATGPTRLP